MQNIPPTWESRLTYSSSVSEPESDSVTLPPQVGNCGEVKEEMETKTKGYSANLIAVGSEDTHLPDDDETSVTGGLWHSR